MGELPVRKRITRQEEVVINRLRAGHTWLTHHQLMNVERGGAVPYTYCAGVNSVKHILLECEEPKRVRDFIFRSKVTLEQLVMNSNRKEELILFLKETHLFELI